MSVIIATLFLIAFALIVVFSERPITLGASATKREEEAMSALTAKYNEDFNLISISSRIDKNDLQKYQVQCWQDVEPIIVFSAIIKHGEILYDNYVASKLCRAVEEEINHEIWNGRKDISFVYVDAGMTPPWDNDADITLREYVEKHDAVFTAHMFTTKLSNDLEVLADNIGDLVVDGVTIRKKLYAVSREALFAIQYCLMDDQDIEAIVQKVKSET